MELQEALEIFKKHLREQGQRFTPERSVILETVLNSAEHFSAESLVSWLKRQRHSVSLATVYRTLPVLVKAGFIQPTVKQGDVEYYERNKGEHQHHDHLLCVSCGKIVEFYNSIIEQEQDRIAKQYGFKLLTHSLELRGECRNCSKRRIAQ